MLTQTQARALFSGQLITIGLNILSGKYPLRDHNNIDATVSHMYDGEFVYMKFNDDCGEVREIKARPSDSAFWSKASVTGNTDVGSADESTRAVGDVRVAANPNDLRDGDRVVFKLYSTAGNHPMTDPDNVEGTVLRPKTAAYVRIKYVDGCGTAHKIRVSKRTDRQFWSTCFMNVPTPTHTTAPVVQSTRLIEVRTHVATTRTAIESITTRAKASVDLLEDLKAHVDDRLATMADTLVALDEELDTVRDELEQAVTKLES